MNFETWEFIGIVCFILSIVFFFLFVHMLNIIAGIKRYQYMQTRLLEKLLIKEGETIDLNSLLEQARKHS